MAHKIAREQDYLDALCTLTLASAKQLDASVQLVNALSAAEKDEFLRLADAHHVIIRAMVPVLAHQQAGPAIKHWAAETIRHEEGRIRNALNYLERICEELEAAACRVVVMKTLDHWPDLGNDMDLYSTAAPADVCKVMQEKLDAHIEPRSWGDRLANKWNFAIPGLPESVEIHVQRLGQTGEHTDLARRFVTRRQSLSLNGHTFLIPAPEERIVVATLQRMYRHFYFRVCDIVNSAAIAESGTLDFTELKRISEYAGIWPGVATYLQIVSDKVAAYRGTPVALPAFVTEAAQFGGDKIHVNASFLRVPVMPQGIRLYTEQITRTALRGDVPATFRLGLLPPLASAAAISFKLTGSDKGIW